MTLYRIRPHNWRLIDGEWIATEPQHALVEQTENGWLPWWVGQQHATPCFRTAEEAMRHIEEQHQGQILPYLEEVVDGS